jgi:hypothetical protein
MKTSVYSSNSVSIIRNPQIEDVLDLSGFKNYTEVEKKKLTKTEKRQLKGMIKSFLGIAYFLALVYFLFVLLS